MLFITHDLDLAAAICDRTIVMYAGQVVEVRRSELLHSDPLHPYTAALAAARPDIAQKAAPAARYPRPAAVGVRGACGASARSRRGARTPSDACRNAVPPT